MRPLEKIFEQTEFIHDLQRRGMHGVAAKVAEEIRMLLQHHDIDAGAAEEITEHHASRTSADDAAADFQGARCGLV